MQVSVGKAAFEDSLPAVVGGLGIVTILSGAIVLPFVAHFGRRLARFWLTFAFRSVVVAVLYLYSLETHARAITWVSCILYPVFQVSHPHRILIILT